MWDRFLPHKPTSRTARAVAWSTAIRLGEGLDFRLLKGGLDPNTLATLKLDLNSISNSPTDRVFQEEAEDGLFPFRPSTR